MGHQLLERMMELLPDRVYWLTMAVDTMKWVSKCTHCQVARGSYNNPALGSSIALGFYYCSNLLCTLCQNSYILYFNNFNSTIMPICGFHWHSRYSVSFGIIGSGLQGFPVTICWIVIHICFICSFI